MKDERGLLGVSSFILHPLATGMLIGFGVRVLGKPGLRPYDGRRAPSSPHLSVSLAHLRDIFGYLVDTNIRMYRMSSELAPYATHPAWPELHGQIDECGPALEEIGAWARAAQLRLSFHAPSHVALGSVDPGVVESSSALLLVLAGLLDAMRQPPEAVIVVHAGGMVGGLDQLVGRWVRAWDKLPSAIQQRLVLEHDEDGLSLPAALRIHAATGVPVVFDYLHFLLNNPERWPPDEALKQALATWPAKVRPKTHFASPRTELRAASTLDERSGRRRWTLAPPRAGHHSDYANPWEFGHFLRRGQGLRDFDVMLEAKAADLALLRLREDLRRYLPELAPLVEPDRGSR
jgi:UV DNA damage endonuclease